MWTLVHLVILHYFIEISDPDFMSEIPDFIKKSFCWKSNSYENYLRHIDHVATDHAKLFVLI